MIGRADLNRRAAFALCIEFELGVEVIDGGFDAVDDLGGILALDHQDNAFSDIILPVIGDHATAFGRTDRNFADIADADGPAVLRLDQGVRNVVHAGIKANAAHDHGLIATVHDAAADVAVGIAGCGFDIGERYAIAFQRIRLDSDLILLDCAAKAGDVGDAGHHADGRAHHEILDGAGFVQGHRCRLVEDIAIDFADCGAERRQTGHHAAGQIGITQFFKHLAAREIIVGAILKNQCDDRQAGYRHRPHVADPWRAGQCAFDRQRNGAFDLLGRLARLLGDDDDLYVLHIGEGLDRQCHHSAGAETDQRQHHDENEQAVGRDEPGNAVNHHSPAICALSSSAPSPTMRSPGFSPVVIHEKSSSRTPTLTGMRRKRPGPSTRKT